MTQQSSGWYHDPTNAYVYRYWNGTKWTNQVSSSGATLIDANELDPTVAITPPAPGSSAPPSPQASPVPTMQVTQKSGSAVGTIIAVVFGLFVVIVLIVVLLNQSGDTSTETPETPVTTEAPAP